MKVNQENYDTFWYWINERHRIYQNKEAGLPMPWTDDPIFQTWKFCNVFRQNDKQTKYLMEHLAPHMDEDPAQLLYNIYCFRAFNWNESYEAMGGWQTKYDSTVFERVGELEHQFSGAYMTRGREGIAKWKSVGMTMKDVWFAKEDLIRVMGTECSMERAYKELMNEHFWGWAEFTTYQIVLDLTYTPILKDAYDINEWCAFGPGARRGLQLIYPGLGPKEELGATKQLLQEAPEHIGSHVPTMNLQDIEFSLCELQKYVRIQRGGKSKTKYDGMAVYA